MLALLGVVPYDRTWSPDPTAQREGLPVTVSSDGESLQLRFSVPVRDATWEIARVAADPSHPLHGQAREASRDLFRASSHNYGTAVDLAARPGLGELLNNPPPGAPEWLRALLLDWIAGCTPDTTSQEIACNNCKTTMASASLTGRLEGAARLTTEETERMLRLFRRP